VTVHVRPDNTSKIEAAFVAFDAEHPEVFRELVALAKQFQRRGRGKKVGIGLLFEVLRWRTLVGEIELPALNNNFRSYYARDLMRREPDLRDVFVTRRLGISSHRVP
jgi:hypothetical protein